MAKRLVGQRRVLPSWARRAMNPNTPTTSKRNTVLTASNQHPKTGMEILYPTIRMGRDGKLRMSGMAEALKKGDYMSFDTPRQATEYAKQLSRTINRARKMKPSGAR